MAGLAKRRRAFIKKHGCWRDNVWADVGLAASRFPRCFRLRILPNAVVAAQEGRFPVLMSANRFLL